MTDHPTNDKSHGVPKKAAAGLRLYGWIDPNPNSTKYKFEERAYSSRTGLYHARVRYRATGETAIRTDTDLAAETPEKLLALAYDAQLDLTTRLRKQHLSGDDREQATLFIDGLARYHDEHLARRKQNVREKEPPQINKWLVPFLGSYTLAELKQDGRRIGREWVAWMRSVQSVTWITSGGTTKVEAERAPAGYRVAEQALEIARGVLTAYRDELDLLDFEVNPFDGVRVNKEAGDQRARHLEAAIPLTLVETIAFYMEDMRDVAMTCVLGELGLRQQEAYVLSWDQVLWPSGEPRTVIEVQEAVSGSGRHREIGSPKSESASRLVTLHAPTADVLLALWEAQGRPAIESESRVFPGVATTSTGEPTDGIVNRPGWLKWKFKPTLAALHDEQSLAKLTKLHGKLTPHRLRSAAASAAGFAGVSNAEAMINFGWSRVDTMIAHYERAYQDPDPELRGMPVADQIVLARRHAFAAMTAMRERFALQIEASNAGVNAKLPPDCDTARKRGNEMRKRRAHLREAERRLARCEPMEQRLAALIAIAEAHEE